MMTSKDHNSHSPSKHSSSPSGPSLSYLMRLQEELEHILYEKPLDDHISFEEEEDKLVLSLDEEMIIESEELLFVLSKILLITWILHYDSLLKHLKTECSPDKQLNYLAALADVLGADTTDRFYVFVERPVGTYSWGNKISRLIRQLQRISIKKRLTKLRQVQSKADLFVKKIEQTCHIPAGEWKTRLGLHTPEKMVWHANLLYFLVLLDKMEHETVQTIFEDLKQLAKKKRHVFLYQHVDDLIDDLGDMDEEHNEKMFDAEIDDEAYAEQFQDFLFVRNNPEKFVLGFTCLTAGIDHAVTLLVTLSLLSSDGYENPGQIEDETIQLHWEDVWAFFFDQKPENWKSNIERLSEEEFNQGITSLVEELMAFLDEKQAFWGLDNLIFRTQAKLDLDFTRIGMKETSGLSESWRRRFGYAFMEKMIDEVEKEGIPALKVDIPLDDLYAPRQDEDLR